MLADVDAAAAFEVVNGLKPWQGRTQCPEHWVALVGVHSFPAVVHLSSLTARAEGADVVQDASSALIDDCENPYQIRRTLDASQVA